MAATASSFFIFGFSRRRGVPPLSPTVRGSNARARNPSSASRVA
ncbi:Uncharacterised protein [Mycobacteroides abscessus subsp. abscessus]|nr:Uncharacterised protein [Mycobacteroides abscessus subsp. abscessus]SKT65942.1 Uncharacterised protein [Mycobacteroides abscessus subsp. abscessus]SKU12127.1 Uncharacterised protein [Mycobacteroides abscessus subsp. abscessus]